MSSPDHLVAVYKDLADWHAQKGQQQLRDRFLVLAADAALLAGRDSEAERLRLHLLRLNPHHLLRPFATLREALASLDVQNYLGELRRSYPPARAEEMLDEVKGSQPPPPPKEDMIPATTPVLDLDEWWPDHIEGSGPLKVYSEGEENLPTHEQTLPVASASSRRTALPTPRPAQAPTTAPAVPTLDPFSPPGPFVVPGEETEDVPRGEWVSVGLFVIILVAGLALAVYSAVTPFLPSAWRE